MYEENQGILKELVESGAVLWPSEVQNKPDGTPDLVANKTLWNNAVARFRVMPLWEEGAPGFDDRDPLQPQPSLVFVPAQGAPGPRGTIIVAHGGAFLCRAGHEGFHTAWCFVQAGFNAAVLTYRLSPYTRLDAMADLHRAIRLLRHRAEELGITQKIAALGFSAGGMLSGNCATHYDGGDPTSADPVERQSCRPDAAVLGYGAFAFRGLPGGFFVDPFADKTRNPFGNTRRDLVYFAPEVNITLDTPPFFIWQTNSDDPRHSFTLGQALTAVGVPFEMHLFPMGVHGLALADGNNDLDMDLPHVAQWAPLCAQWLESLEI